MVLLRGANYDFSAQQKSKFDADAAAAAVSITVENTEGFAVDDYVVLHPRNEQSEIVKVTAVTDDTTLAVTALKFAHFSGEFIYRMPYNRMRFYSSTSATGTYALIAGSETELSYADDYTTYEYVAGTSALFYKRTFYNTTTTTESDIAISDYWQTSEEELILTPDELRALMLLDKQDCPDENHLRTIMRLAQDNVLLDISTSNPAILRIAMFLRSKASLLRALAVKAKAKGYITINIEGREITKAEQEFILDAENTKNEYMSFISANLTNEVKITKFLTDSAFILPETRTQVLDLWQGSQNVADLDNTKYYGRRRRY